MIFQLIYRGSAATQHPVGGGALGEESHRVQVHGSLEEAKDVMKPGADVDAKCCGRDSTEREKSFFGVTFAS